MSKETSAEQLQSSSPNKESEQPNNFNDQKLSIIARAKALSKRIFSYYFKWPVIIAILAILLNCLSAIEGMPLRWLLTGGSTLLILVLVGHSGTRLDEPLQDVRNLAERSHVEVNDVRHKADSALNKSTKFLRRSQKIAARVKSANASANEALKTASVVSKVAHAASHSATSALQTSLVSKRLSELSQEKSKQSDLSSKVALDRAKLALTKSNQSMQKSEIAIASADTNRTKTFQALKKINANNTRLFQPFNRYLEEDVLEELTNTWTSKLNIQINSRALGYLAHRICLIEDTCSGRLAANVESMLFRILIARSVEHDNLSVLEIGSLFGISLGIIHESCQGYFQSVSLTALDPLDGYYGQSKFDTITEVPVSRQIFEHNMRRLDIPVEDVTLIQDLSTQDEVVERVNRSRYNLLIIDGDHSYEGVKFDFDHYLNCVEPGGYIIFDDYESEYWPAIATFVNEEVKPNPCVEFIGSSWKTAVFKVKGKSDRDLEHGSTFV